MQSGIWWNPGKQDGQASDQLFITQNSSTGWKDWRAAIRNKNAQAKNKKSDKHSETSKREIIGYCHQTCYGK